ncbi:MAG: lysophospholipase [Methylococcales bacterium]
MQPFYAFTLSLILSLLNGCMPMTHPPGAKVNLAQLHENTFITPDGARLPLRHWLPNAAPQAIVIALHGFNDYSHFFDQPGTFLSKQGIACYAYDQRGFGEAPERGLWAGSTAYRDDLQTLTNLIKQRYPQQPVYLLGESMGGAVVITAISQGEPLPVDGVVLVAPALWARSTMPWYQTSLLWTLAHTMPWLTLTGQSVGARPSDNIEMLRALGRDPLVIKGTRVESIFGLTNLMDEAFDSATLLRGNTLLLYGEKDEIIPKKPTVSFLQKWLSSDTNDKTVAFYEQGYHMLLRDLQAEKPWQDIAAWIKERSTKLPSGADARAQQVLASHTSGAKGS